VKAHVWIVALAAASFVAWLVFGAWVSAPKPSPGARNYEQEHRAQCEAIGGVWDVYAPNIHGCRVMGRTM
jgi:hypothetical protein